MRIGLMELIVIVVIAIAMIKPEKLGVLARNIAKAIKIIKEENNKLNKDIVEPAKEAVAPIADEVKDAVKPVQELKSDIESTVADIKKEITPSVDLNKTEEK